MPARVFTLFPDRAKLEAERAETEHRVAGFETRVAAYQQRVAQDAADRAMAALNERILLDEAAQAGLRGLARAKLRAQLQASRCTSEDWRDQFIQAAAEYDEAICEVEGLLAKARAAAARGPDDAA
jgi:hypothetical protein